MCLLTKSRFDAPFADHSWSYLHEAFRQHYPNAWWSPDDTCDSYLEQPSCFLRSTQVQVVPIYLSRIIHDKPQDDEYADTADKEGEVL